MDVSPPKNCFTACVKNGKVRTWLESTEPSTKKKPKTDFLSQLINVPSADKSSRIQKSMMMSSEDSDDESSGKKDLDVDMDGGLSDVSNASFSILDQPVLDEEAEEKILDEKGEKEKSGTTMAGAYNVDTESSDSDSASIADISFSQKDTIIEIDSDTDYFEASQNIKSEPLDEIDPNKGNNVNEDDDLLRLSEEEKEEEEDAKQQNENLSSIGEE